MKQDRLESVLGFDRNHAYSVEKYANDLEGQYGSVMFGSDEFEGFLETEPDFNQVKFNRYDIHADDIVDFSTDVRENAILDTYWFRTMEYPTSEDFEEDVGGYSDNSIDWFMADLGTILVDNYDDDDDLEAEEDFVEDEFFDYFPERGELSGEMPDYSVDGVGFEDFNFHQDWWDPEPYTNYDDFYVEQGLEDYYDDVSFDYEDDFIFNDTYNEGGEFDEFEDGSGVFGDDDIFGVGGADSRSQDLGAWDSFVNILGVGAKIKLIDDLLVNAVELSPEKDNLVRLSTEDSFKYDLNDVDLLYIPESEIKVTRFLGGDVEGEIGGEYFSDFEYLGIRFEDLYDLEYVKLEEEFDGEDLGIIGSGDLDFSDFSGEIFGITNGDILKQINSYDLGSFENLGNFGVDDITGITTFNLDSKINTVGGQNLETFSEISKIFDENDELLNFDDDLLDSENVLDEVGVLNQILDAYIKSESP